MTPMTLESMDAAWRAVQDHYPAHLILSVAYSCHFIEAGMKKSYLEEKGIDESMISTIGPVVDSFDEVQKLAQIIGSMSITKLVVVAEEWHAKRALMILRMWLPPEFEIEMKTFSTSRFEKTFEPHPVKILGWIKSIRAGYALPWIIWNKLNEWITPLMIRRKMKSAC
ncbi:MAG: ElyC/SanA/YdcF family protein [Patescibacteria group bacterium]